MPLGVAIAVHPQLGDTNAAEAPPGPTIYLLDTFIEASPPVSLAAHTMDTGPGWSDLGGQSYRIAVSGEVEMRFGQNGFAVSDAAVSDLVTCEFTVDQADGSALLVRSSSDAGSFILCEVSAADNIGIYDAAGVPYAANSTGFSITFPATIRVVLDGEDIDMEIVGVSGATVSTTTSDNLARTFFGIRLPGEAFSGSDFSVAATT